MEAAGKRLASAGIKPAQIGEFSDLRSEILLPEIGSRRISLSIFSCCYNAAVFPKSLVIAVILSLSVSIAQEATTPKEQPQVKVNVLNVCTPSADEQQEMRSALGKIPQRPSFSEDFEVDRGRSVLDQNASPLSFRNADSAPAGSTVADFVRLRRDINGGPYANVQYSFSRDSKQMVETLVFRVRDPKDLLQVSIEDSASSVTSASSMLVSATPASRIKLERLGKSSVVLARCSATGEGPAPDQSKYEPLFASASSALADYRQIFEAKILVPEELARIARARTRPGKPPAKNPGSAAHK
jgi:hypothetical protein